MYTYDSTGNRKSISISGQVYAVNVAANSNRLTSAAGPLPAKTYSIDAAGNVTGDGTRTYTYSDRGRRSSMTAGSGSVTYLYNALEQRVRKAGAGTLASIGVIDYVYDDAGHLIGEYDANGLVQETVYLGDMPVAVLKRNASGQMLVNYVFADHLNTPRMIVRASDNKLVWQWLGTDPFGAIQPLEDPSALGAFVYNLRFPGQVYDKESGLYYNHHRDYDPQTGRYVESDPIGLDGGVNTYGYVSANPLSSIDFNGLQAGAASSAGSAFEAAAAAAARYSPANAANQNTLAMDGDRSRGRGDADAVRRRESSRACPADPDKPDPCDEIRTKIRDIERKLASKERQLAENQYDLYNRAYDTNPGGDLAGKGTYVGHLAQIKGLGVGLERAIAKAREMGCL